ncbi:hypothetical protein BT63DRAFT_460990 [Microthyrium microscopicum]|uniref:Uncharacterized protein n=1 Tax=Microthyrium microscopicum TaxID=703497 RepID=A0A6A6TX11_9PEZI|nr:hypothetical protein BT63DRAFT_460990 [Microthyrium microscopicum]
MQKIKGILNPGGNTTDELMYDMGDSSKKSTGDSTTATSTSTPSTGHAASGISGPEHEQQHNIAPATQGISQNDPRHEVGRDAALGAGAGAVGASVTGNQPHSSTSAQQYPIQSGPTAGSGLQDTTQHGTIASTGTGAPTNTTATGQQHHYGRDAAVGAGAVGAAEAAHHSHNKHEDEEVAGEDGEKKPSLLKRIFHHGDKDESKHESKHDHKEESKHHHTTTAAAAGESAHHEGNRLHKDNPNEPSVIPYKHQDVAGTDTSAPGLTQKSEDHHYGRDAAVGAGAVGAGAAAHHHHEKKNADDNTHAHTQPATTVGGHGAVSQSAVAGQNQPTSATDQHHYGRDAAVGTGVLGAGAAAHHAHETRGADHHTGAAETGTIPYKHQDVAAANTSSTPGQTQASSDHHYGRDAAVGAGALGAGAAAHHHHENKDVGAGEQEHNKTTLGSIYKHGIQGPPEQTNMVTGHHEGASAGSSGLGHNQATGTDHHYGRDAAVGAGALGGAGALAHHEHEKKAGDDGLVPRTAPGYGSAPGQSQSSTDHHYGRDAALGAGALGGAGALAHHEHDKKAADDGLVPRTAPGYGSSAPQTAGASLGSGTHNTGSEFASTSHTAGDGIDSRPSTGHHSVGIANKLDPHVKPDGDNGTRITDTMGQDQHHYGRDAAIGAGALGGAGALAHHEHGKHDQTHASSQAPTALGGQTHQYPGQREFGADPNISDPGQTNPAPLPTAGGQEHHYGRDAALGAGALGGAGALASHEHNKSDNNKNVLPQDTVLAQNAGLAAHQPHQERSVSNTAVKSVAMNDEPKHDAKHEGGKHFEGGLLGIGKSHKDKSEPTSAKHDHSSTSPAQVPESDNEKHHLGRDAALGAGAVGAGTAAHKHHEKTADEHESAADKEKKPGLLEKIFHRGEGKEIESHQPPLATTNDSKDHYQPGAAVTGSDKDHHYGRDAALGAGAVGAGAAAHKHHEKAADENESPADKEKKPSLIEKIFHRGEGKEVEQHQPPLSSTNDTKEHYQPGATTADSEHHYGRDAALGAGAAGLGGAAIHEHSKATDNKTDKRDVHFAGAQNTPTTTQQQKTPFTSTPSGHPVNNLGSTTGTAPSQTLPDRSVQSQATQQHKDSHNSALTAALAGAGVGAVGAGALAHDQSAHGGRATTEDSAAAAHPTGATVTNPSEELPHVPDDNGKFLNQKYLEDETTAHGHQVSGLGAGTAGAVVGGASQAHKDSLVSEEDPATKTKGPHKSNILNVLDPRVKPDKISVDEAAGVEQKHLPSDGATTGTHSGPQDYSAGPLRLPEGDKLTPVGEGHSGAGKPIMTTTNATSSSAATGASQEAGQGHGTNPYTSTPLDPRVSMPGTYPDAK